MKTLQLGCGVRPIEGAINHDRVKHSEHVDIAHNLDVLPWPWDDGAFDKVIALDVMEHLRCEVRIWLNECWRILSPDGLLVLRLPAWNHECSHRDPTHIRLFHPETFSYWDRRTDWHRDYGRYYYGEYDRWWLTENVELRDNGANIAYVLRKDSA